MRQNAAILGFDVLFAEPDDSSGLKTLKQLAQTELRDQAGFSEQLSRLQSRLDYDALFAGALRQRPVVLGYYFSSDQQGRTKGVLPAPVMQAEALQGRPIRLTSWNGYGANIEPLARAAPMAGSKSFSWARRRPACWTCGSRPWEKPIQGSRPMPM